MRIEDGNITINVFFNNGVSKIFIQNVPLKNNNKIYVIYL